MHDIDWSKAPEGATHYNPHALNNPWRKITDGAVFAFVEQSWVEITGGARNIYIAGPLRAKEFAAHPYGPPTHPDNLAVHNLANAMRLRLSKHRQAGKSGWDDPEQCPPQRLADGLVRAVRKGELIDVANYAAMLLARGKSDGLSRHTVHALLVAALGRTARESAPVEWDGTGLPPAGTVCEFSLNLGTIGWQKGWVIGHEPGGITAVVRYSGKYYPRNVHGLRPILTPEQRAAKERDEAVAAMCKAIEERPDVQHANTSLDASVAIRVAIEALYDAGWRKTEGEA